MLCYEGRKFSDLNGGCKERLNQQLLFAAAAGRSAANPLEAALGRLNPNRGTDRRKTEAATDPEDRLKYCVLLLKLQWFLNISVVNLKLVLQK